MKPIKNVNIGGDDFEVKDEVARKLYTETGQNTDGAMTQKAVTDAIKPLSEKIQSFEDTKSEIASSGLGTALGLAVSDTWTQIVAKLKEIVNRGAINATISGSGGSYTIPKGYHNGSGKVTGPTYTPAKADLQLVPIIYTDGNGELGNGTKFATYAYGNTYKDCSEKMFNALSIGDSVPVNSIGLRCVDVATDYAIFYYPKAWRFLIFKWHTATQNGYGLQTLKLFQASNDGSSWTDVSSYSEFGAGAGNSKGGYLKYTGSSFYKYWKVAFTGNHSASNIVPTLIGVYRPS